MSTSARSTTTTSASSLVDKFITTTSASGLSKTIQTDLNGDGTIDRANSGVTVINADGSTTETITTTSNSGTLLAKTVKTVSADQKTVTYTRDVNGDAATDETETLAVQSDGSTVDTVSDFAPNGTLKDKSIVTTSANGLSVTTQLDVNGDGVYDLTRTDVTVLNSDGSRAETVTDKNANASVRDQTIATVSANGLSSTRQADLNGDGTFDLTAASTTVLNSDGSRTTTVSDKNADGSLRDEAVTTVSATGLSITSQLDVNGDGVFERASTDVTALNADGSTTETVSVTAANGSLLSRSVNTTSADGRTVTVSRDINGDGNADQTESVSTAANGTVTDKVTDLNTDGSIKDSATTTTNGNGTIVTVALDLNGDGTADRTRTSTLAYNADGSTTLTQADTSANGTLVDKFITTTSASGLSQTVQSDLNGDGTIDRANSDVTVINADGSTTETITTTSNSGTLLAKTVKAVSADRKTVTYTRDVNGDAATDETETIAVQSDGGTVDTVSDFAPNGTLKDKTIVTTSASGLSVTTQLDVNGDGVYDLTRTDVTVLNSDGSRTETVTDKNANASVRDQTIATVSANGLSSTRQVDLNGDGVFDVTTASTTVLNSNGSQTTTVTDKNANGSLRDQSVTTVSATGLSTTKQFDLNGDGVFDQTITDATALNSDGSKTETVMATNANGSLRSQSVTTTSADGRTVTITRDTNGDGNLDQTESITTAANGAVTDKVAYLNPDGSIRGSTTTAASANGLTVTKSADLNGDGVADDIVTTSTVLNADGSTVKTVSVYRGTTLTSQTVTTASADGRSVTTAYDRDGNGTTDLTSTDVTVLNANGSITETLTDTSANGIRRDQSTTTISADKKTITVATSVDDNAPVAMQKTIAVQANGSTVTTVSYPGSYFPTETDTRTTSATGLSNSIVIKDRYGDYLNVSDVTTLNSDGSRTETFRNADGWGYNSTITTSANGLSKTVSMSGRVGYWPDPALSLSGTDVTVLNSDGSRTETIADTITQRTSNSTSVNDKSVTTTSANGLSVTAQLDVNNDGRYDRTDAQVTAVDGSKTETITINNIASGALQQKDVIAISADGLTQSLQRDTNGDGTFDHFETTVNNANGSVTGTVWDTNASGTLLDKFVTTTSGNGLSSTTTSDVNGDGLADYTQTSIVTLNADGSRTAIVTDYYANGTMKDRTVSTASANGLSKTTQIDMNGDGTADETQTDVTTVNANGTNTRVISNYYADGTLKDQTTVTNDTDRYDFFIDTTFDTNGDGKIEKDVFVEVDQDGYKAQYTTFYNADGSVKSSTETDTSMDGSTVSTWINGSNPKTDWADSQIYYMPNANGSYEWYNYPWNSSVWQSATHTIDLNGVDNWVWMDQQDNQAAVYHTTVIDLASEQKAVDIARRLYDTAFDRSMQVGEVQLLAENITNGVLDTTALANKVIASTEFTQKYGTLTNVQFVELVYKNALGHAPSIADLKNWVSQLDAQTATRAAVMIAVSESEEHILTGNVHQVSNNTDTASSTYTLDHTTDRVVANTVVDNLYETALGRAADQSGLSTYSAALLNGTMTATQIAAALTGSSEFVSKYGSMTNADFVSQIFANGLGRLPTTAEAAYWAAELTSGAVSKGDLVAAMSQSPDHLQTQNQQVTVLSVSGTGNTIHATGDTLNFTAGSSGTVDSGGNTINMAAGSAITVNTSGETINAVAGSTVTFAANLTGTVSGSGVTVNVATYDSLTASSDTINVAANATATLTGSSNTINVGEGDTLTVSGSSDSFVFQPAFGIDTINGFASTDSMTFSTSDFADWSALQSHMTQSGSSTVITLDASDKITLTNVATSSLQSSQFHFQ